MSFRLNKLVLSVLLPFAASVHAGTDLVIDIASPETAKINETIQYTISVANEGSDVAKEIAVNYQIPAGMAFISAKSFLGQCSVAAQMVTCQLRNLQAGSTARVRGEITTKNSGSYTTQVDVSSNETDTQPANNRQTGTLTVLGSSDMEITLSDSDDPVKPGEAVTYTAVVTNHGPDNAGRFFVETSFPSLDKNQNAVEAVSAEEAKCVITELEDNTPSATCEFSNLAVGDSVTVQAVVRPADVGANRVVANINMSNDWDNPDRFKDQVTEMTAVLGFKTKLKVTARGEGSVTDDKGLINCGEKCEVVYPRNERVTLTPVAAPGYSFKRWWGACNSEHKTCVVEMSKARRVTATFTEKE